VSAGRIAAADPYRGRVTSSADAAAFSSAPTDESAIQTTSPPPAEPADRVESADSAEAQVITLNPPAAALPSASDSWLADALHSTLVRAIRAQTLTAPAGLILAAALLVPGVLVDLLTDATAGRPTAISFLLAAGIPPLVVRRKALATAAVAPPVLFASALLVLAWASGQNATNRQVVMDAGTSLALTAPHLFAGTVVGVVLVLARLSWGLVHRG
jgi:hypothetical protein